MLFEDKRENAMNEKIQELFDAGQRWLGNNQSLIRGYGFLVLGAFLVYLTIKVVLNMMLFVAGVALIYDASRQLQYFQVSNFIEGVFSYLGCSCKKMH
jgi:hypothetical protein